MSVHDLGLNLQRGQKVWLSAEVLGWPATTKEMLAGHTKWQGHYAPWEHANKSLLGSASHEDRACAILQLRRALEFRDKALKSVYSPEKIVISEKKKYWELLSKLGIVLPIMRKKLVDLRDIIAHEYMESPPNVERCQEYSEFVWYYLKSTDHLLSSPIGTLGFDDAGCQGGYDVTFSLENWATNLSGEFDVRLITQAQKQDDIEIEVFEAQLSDERVYFKIHPHTRNGSNCKMSRASMLKLLKIYFATKY